MTHAIAELEAVAERRTHNALIYREGRSGAPITREEEIAQAEVWEAQAAEMRDAVEWLRSKEEAKRDFRDAVEMIETVKADMENRLADLRAENRMSDY